MHVYLVGYRGSGKTTVGKLLAQRLNRPCVDCDDLIESSAGKSIREIFAAEGEAGFRIREREEIERLARAASEQPMVVSLGGGAILSEENRSVICDSGYRVWLCGSPETLLARIRSDASTAARRPALSTLTDYEEIVALLESRRPLYEAVAQKIVQTDYLCAESISDDIAVWLSSVTAAVPNTSD